MIYFITFIVLLFVNINHALASACCAGNGAAPSIISGNDAAQVSISAARGIVIGDAPTEGIPVFRNDKHSEITDIYLLSGAILLSDFWQVGGNFPILSHRAAGDSDPADRTTGLGDIRLNLAYEYLPEWTYSSWKPKGFVFLQFTLPTGSSIYDTQTIGGMDALGKGFYSLGIGNLLVKRWSTWDVYSIPEIHLNFGRTFQTDSVAPMQVDSSWGGSFSLGVGVSPGSGNFRFGLRLQPLYESARNTIRKNLKTLSPYQLAWNTALEATYLASNSWSINAVYIDQTLVGPATNSVLSRTFTLGLQHRWER